MAKYSIEGSTLTGIADAIREKTGESGSIKVEDMAEKVSGISGGGSGGEIETSTIIIKAVESSYRDIYGLCFITINDNGNTEIISVYCKTTDQTYTVAANSIICVTIDNTGFVQKKILVSNYKEKASTNVYTVNTGEIITFSLINNWE